MAASPEYQPLIDYFRFYGQAGTTDIFNGVVYWTDEQLEGLLIEHSSYGQAKLYQLYDNNYRKFGFDMPKHMKFVNDLSIEGVANLFAYDVRNGVLTFETDVKRPRSDGLLVTGMVIHMWDALAHLWDLKASQRYDFIDWKAGHNTMYQNQQYLHCIQQRDYYRNKVIRRHAK